MVETEREIMDTVRSRQKRWLGHILRHDSLLRITLGEIQGKKAYRRPRTMFSDWLLKTKNGNISYKQPKDVRPGQIKMESMKMETCHMAEHCREILQMIIIAQTLSNNQHS